MDYATVIAILGLAISVVKLYLDQRKAKRDLELSKGGLEVLSRLIESYRRGRENELQLQKQRLEWERRKDLAKAVGWILDRLEEEEEEE